MKLKWMDADNTILQVEIAPNHCRIVEAGNYDWPTLSQRDGIEPYVPPPTPTPEEAREAEIARLRAAREAAYRAEADPINKKWQRGEAEKADWLAAVEAIRARYPYPE